jgi:hypothetical protein
MIPDVDHFSLSKKINNDSLIREIRCRIDLHNPEHGESVNELVQKIRIREYEITNEHHSLRRQVLQIILGTTLGAGTRDNILGTRDNILGTRDNILGTRDNILGTRDNILGTRDNSSHYLTSIEELTSSQKHILLSYYLTKGLEYSNLFNVSSTIFYFLATVDVYPYAHTKSELAVTWMLKIQPSIQICLFHSIPRKEIYIYFLYDKRVLIS